MSLFVMTNLDLRGSHILVSKLINLYNDSGLRAALWPPIGLSLQHLAEQHRSFQLNCRMCCTCFYQVHTPRALMLTQTHPASNVSARLAKKGAAYTSDGKIPPFAITIMNPV